MTRNVPDENSLPYSIPSIISSLCLPNTPGIALALFTGRLNLFRVIDLPSSTICTWWLPDLKQILTSGPEIKQLSFTFFVSNLCHTLKPRGYPALHSEGHSDLWFRSCPVFFLHNLISWLPGWMCYCTIFLVSPAFQFLPCPSSAMPFLPWTCCSILQAGTNNLLFPNPDITILCSDFHFCLIPDHVACFVFSFGFIFF